MSSLATLTLHLATIPDKGAAAACTDAAPSVPCAVPGTALLTLQVERGQTLAQAIWLSGEVTPPPLCSALGRCGRCRVRFVSPAPAAVAAEHSVLSPHELTQGWRLACRHSLAELSGAVEIVVPTARNAPIRPSAAQPTEHDLLLAVDLGTTSLHWRALTHEGGVVAQGQEINPQMGAGSDVMSRIAAALRPGGREKLSELVLRRLRALVQEFPAVQGICLAANTALTAITLQKDVTGLASAPYALPLAGDSVARLPGLPPLYIPPQMAPFVGGDLSAGLATLLHREPPFLLADMGTNGEFILYVNEQESYMASVPLGPALEGIGLTFGDMAGSGSSSGIVNAVQLTPTGLVATTVDGQPPQRLCAAGYLSLIRVLLQAKILREDGSFCPDPPLPLARKLAARLTRTDAQSRLPLWGEVYLTGEDVEEILKVKAAFSLALTTLLEEAHMPPAALRRIYLAGALGEHVPAQDMEALGFVPQGMGQRMEAVGNTALQGAQALALHPALRHDLAHLTQHCHLVALAEHDAFTEKYVRHMRFCQP